MAGDVGAEVAEVLGRADFFVDCFEGAVFLLFEVPVDVLARDDNHILVKRVEG